MKSTGAAFACQNSLGLYLQGHCWSDHSSIWHTHPSRP